ncbi:MAG TPA: glycosyltransferase family 4 protein [Bryocella sp.]|nr:glycosyltransferase family 4 protein [Bryocella sp.]
MRVLILATDIFSRGGIARYTATVASALGDLLGPQNVDVLCFFDWGHNGEVPTGFRLVDMVSSRKGAGLLSRLQFLQRSLRAGATRYDLVIANHVALAPVAALLKLIFGTPYWVSCHSVEIWWGTTRARLAALKKADLILPVSRYTADVIQHIKGIDGSRVRVLHNAIPGALTQALLREGGTATEGDGAPMLLSVCNLVRGNEFKGIDTVLEALPRVLRAVPDLQYVVVGEGELRPKLEAFAVKAGVVSNVRFAGEAPDSELVELYRRCDAFVLPSRGQELRGAIGGEGFGRVYVEAALAGKPVIGSCRGGAAEAVRDGETGLLPDPDSVDDVAEALLAVLTNPERAAAMGRAGRRWAQKTFTQDALSGSLQLLLRPYGFEPANLPQLAHAGGSL